LHVAGSKEVTSQHANKLPNFAVHYNNFLFFISPQKREASAPADFFQNQSGRPGRIASLSWSGLRRVKRLAGLNQYETVAQPPALGAVKLDEQTRLDEPPDCDYEASAKLNPQPLA